MNRLAKAYDIYRAQGWTGLTIRLGQYWRPYAGLLDSAWMRWSSALPGPANRRRLRVFALRRSGHHAVLNWIRYQLPGRHCLLNDCVPGENPFASCSRGNSLVRGWAGEHQYLDWTRELAGRHAKKGTLIYNYEDCDFRELPGSMAEKPEEEWLGAGGPRQDVLILRDPFNLFASKLRWARGQNLAPGLAQFPALREMWKGYAREFLGETRFLEGCVPISYNEWFSSRLYRDNLADRLGFRNHDRGLDEVAKWGPTTWGDSFDALKYDGQARQMKVLERWREYLDDEFFRAQFRDPELIELSRRIFGELPGTAVLLGNASP